MRRLAAVVAAELTGQYGFLDVDGTPPRSLHDQYRPARRGGITSVAGAIVGS